MADNDNRPYVGYRSAGRRPESRNDRTAAANAPLNVLRGWAAGTLGLPGDVESLVRMLPGISEKNTLPTTEYFEERLPLRDMSPTGRAFTGLGTLTGGAGVATGAKAASRGAQALAPAAGALAMRAAELSGAPVYGMGVIKPKGGNWLAGSVEDTVGDLKRAYVPDPELLRIARENGVAVNEDAVATNEALARWMDQKLGKYVKNEMGTPEDPIRLLAEKGVTHSEVAGADTFGPHIGRRRLDAGYPAEGMGVSPEARAWEANADDIIHNMPAGMRINVNDTGEASALKNLKENPWLAKVPPETMTYGTYRTGFEGQTQFGHMIDELRNAVNPESGLPANLRWKYQDLDKVTVPQAVQRVHDINEWRAAQKAEANAARANNAAAFTHKDYPDAPYKWVELKQPETEKITELPEGWRVLEDSNNGHKFHYVVNEHGGTIPGSGFTGKTHEEAVANTIKGLNSSRETQALEDALKYEGETMGHCVGGYCPDVLEGRSRIFSLRNKKTGEPHVTIEVGPSRNTTSTKFSDVFDEAMQHVDDNEYAALESEYGGDLYEGLKERYGNHVDNPQEAVYDLINTFNPDKAEKYKAGLETGAEDIIQIKGKANKAPKEDYLPYVQDFVRSNQWGRVGDLENAGLTTPQFHAGAGTDYEKAMTAKYGEYWPKGVAEENWRKFRENEWKIPEEGFAEGGLVGHAEYSPLDVDYIIDNVMSGQHEPAYAEGGLAPYGLRHSGEGAKGKGYYGLLPNSSGGVSTEISAEDDDLGEYPLMVPNLTADELKHLLNNERPTEQIYDKARSHAKMRKAAGRSTFIESGELRRPKPEGFAEGGFVEYNPAKISSLVNALREELNA